MRSCKKVRRSREATVLFLFSLFLCTGCFRNEDRIVTLAGSTAFQPFAEELAKQYMEIYPETIVSVQAGGSMVGIQAVEEGIADIGMVDLSVIPEEDERLLNAVAVAQDGIALIVHPTNPVHSLTLEEVKALFSGKATHWSQVGGRNIAVHIISREGGSGTRKSFDTLVLGESPLSRDAFFQDSNGTIREAVASNPHAIGYLSVGTLSPEVKALSLSGIFPSNENVLSHLYPLAHPIFFLTRKDPPLSLHTQKFLSFVLSPEGQGIIAKKGLIPILPVEKGRK
ncbi:MAG: phosphate ABC transporter substrate-binding protein [Candidatus Ratteibacteria bacterium]|jgi:phosphate transport system substrate-binding protein